MFMFCIIVEPQNVQKQEKKLQLLTFNKICSIMKSFGNKLEF